MAFVALYDACVLYPASLRDLLVRLATKRLFRARFTDTILDEMVESILRSRPDLSRDRLERTRDRIIKTVRDGLVHGYESLIPTLELPDPGDRHVLAAAIRAGAQVIVTTNLKDFPDKTLSAFDVEAQHPDVFISHLVELSPGTLLQVVREQAADLIKPPATPLELLDRLEQLGLVQSVAALRDLIR